MNHGQDKQRNKNEEAQKAKEVVNKDTPRGDDATQKASHHDEPHAYGQMKTLITRRAQALAQSLATTRQAKQRPFQALKSLKKSAFIKTISISSLMKPTRKEASSLRLQP